MTSWPAPDPHPASALARLQQGLTLSALAGAALWGLWWWPQAPVTAALGVAALPLGHAFVLTLQFAVMATLNRHDPARSPTPGASLGAWWAEWLAIPRVFLWLQPFRWNTWPDADVPATPGRAAVVFVHGFACNRGIWLPWMRAMRRRGLAYTSVNLEPVFGSIDRYAPLIDDAVRRAQSLTGQPPLLVCHSMGGLAARTWLATTPDAARRVRAVVTIGTPHHGTWLARFTHLTNGRQMRIGSDWLGALQAREQGQERPPFVCWYSNADPIVFPASTARLEGADNRHLQGVAHVAMAFHPAVMESSLAMLAPAGHQPDPRGAA